MCKDKEALILSADLGVGRSKRQSSRIKSSIAPLIEVKIDRLKSLGITDIFITVDDFTDSFQKQIRDWGAEPVLVDDKPKNELASFSAAKEYISGQFLITKANRIYPPSILRILSDFELESDFLISVDRQLDEDFVGRRVQLSDDLARPYVRDIGKSISEWNAMDIGIYLSAPVSLYEATALMGEGQHNIVELIKKLDSRVLPFDGVKWHEVDISE